MKSHLGYFALARWPFLLYNNGRNRQQSRETKGYRHNEKI